MLRKGDLAEAVGAASLLAEMDATVSGQVRAALVEMLNDSQIEDWRWSVAAGVLGKIDPKRSGLLELFVARLQSDSPLVQSASLEAITAIALELPDNQPDQFTEARAALLDLLRRNRRPLTEILLQPSGAEFGRVTFRAETPWLDDFVILNAVQAAHIGDSQLLMLLTERAQPGLSERVQLAAAKELLQLGAGGKRLAAEVLAQLMGNRYAADWEAAIEADDRTGTGRSPCRAAVDRCP